MASSVLDALDALDGAPTVAALGGEAAIYASSEVLTRDSRVVEIAVALCNDWVSLDDRDAAASFLIDAVDAVTPLSAPVLFDVLLTSEDALPDIAARFELSLKSQADRPGLTRDFALEAWTRLALGDWASRTHHLRAALQDGSEAEDATPPLVRALGAALTRWQDDALRDALQALAGHDDLDSDAAMELGLNALACAAAEDDAEAVRSGLDEARRWFGVARTDEARPDAVAFDAVIGGVIDQTAGQALPEPRYQAICDSVYEYLDGYAGVSRGWRAPRAHSTTAWMELLGRLQQADTDSWYDPARTIESLARIMSAETTMLLVVNTGGIESHQRGIRALVRPRVEAIAAENAQVLSHIRRWLAAPKQDTETSLQNAVEALLRQLEATPPKKAPSESVPKLDAIRDLLNLTPEAATVMADAAKAHPELLDVYAQLAVHASPPGYAEEQLLDDLLVQCAAAAEGGIDRYRTELTVVLNHLVRFGAFHLNEGQSGVRAAPWYASEKPWPQEHELADDLNRTLCIAGLRSIVEAPNTSGGRVDIMITFPRCKIFIEVKRTKQVRSDSQLVEDYGAQAVQYAATDIPLAFLVVADYSRRKTRLDLPATFRVAPVRLHPESRHHALTTLRLQANVAPPSTSSAKRM